MTKEKKMSGLSAMSRVHIPVRSISLPSRLLHPNSTKIETELSKLKKTFDLPSSALTGAETIQIGLVNLADLFNSVEQLIQSPRTQQALLHHHKNLVEEALDESLKLLDACSNARDLFLTMKERVQDLQSTLRRKAGGGVSSIESGVHSYICFRKKVKKDVAKSLRSLKQMENNIGSFAILVDKDDYLSMVIRVLREVNAITISIFRSLLLFLSVPVLKTKTAAAVGGGGGGGWSLISKLMITGRSQKIVNEVGNVDFALYSLHGRIRRRSSAAKSDVQMEQKRLETLDGSIKGLEAGLDCLFRCLIQYRVSLLNILTN